MKKAICSLLLLAFTLTLMTGCDFSGLFPEEPGSVPKEIEEQYHLYLEAMKESVSSSVEFCYFKNEDRRLSLLKWDGPSQETRTILEWIQLNDVLWAVKVHVLPENPKIAERDNYQFVGYIDGKPYVIPNYHEVPEELSGDLDMRIFRTDDEA